MAYADFAFYKEKYFGDVVPESDFTRLEDRACDYLDTITFGRLEHGLPEQERSQVKIKKAVCAMCDVLYQMELAQRKALAAANGGEGIVTGKSSGSESITYAAPSEAARAASSWSAAFSAAGDPKKSNAMLYEAARPYLAGVCNDEGVNLLYAGV